MLIFSFRRTPLVSPTISSIGARHRENQDHEFPARNCTIPKQKKDYVNEFKALKISS